jgi:hypothetical protein
VAIKRPGQVVPAVLPDAPTAKESVVCETRVCHFALALRMSINSSSGMSFTSLLIFLLAVPPVLRAHSTRSRPVVTSDLKLGADAIWIGS